MAKRPQKKEFALVNLAHKYLVMRGGKPILHVAAQPPHSEDYPSKYSKSAGFSFEPVEVEYSARHVGEPRYSMPDQQKGTVLKTASPKESQ